MTLGIKKHEENGIYITLFWEKGYNNNGTWNIEAYEEHGGLYGFRCCFRLQRHRLG